MAKYIRLHDAIKAGDLKTVKTLVQQGVDVNAVYQQETAFTWAAQCKNFQCANLIMASKKFNPNAGNQFYRSPLFMASKLNRPDFVRRLVQMGARVNDADIRGVTPLGACAWYDSYECAEILIQRGANVDQPDAVGQTPLYRACSNVSKNMVQVLVDHSCDVNLPTCDRKTPLMAALPTINNMNAGKTLTDMLWICQMLATNGCDINAQDENGRTALHHTVESNDVFGMIFLAERGCNLDIKDNTGYTAFQTAIMPRRPRFEMARYLLHLGTNAMEEMLNPDEQDSPKILPIVFLMNTRPNRVVDESDRMSRTWLLQALHYAINPHTIHSYYRVFEPFYLTQKYLNFHDLVEISTIKFIKKHRTPFSLHDQTRIKIRESLGNTNLITKIDTLPICPPLKRNLNLGFPCRVASLESISQLHIAIRDGHNDVVRRLLLDETSVDIVLQHKNALTLAIEVGNKEATMMIMQEKLAENKGNSSMLLTPSNHTALHIASKYGRTDIVREMIALGCNVNAKSIIGSTALQEAFVEGHLEAAAILIRNGANVKTRGQGGAPLLHLAAAAGSKEIVELLIERGWDVNAEDKNDNTALHIAASKGTQYLDMNIPVPFLYDDKTSEIVDYMHRMETLSGPIFTKKHTGHIETVRFLLESGADVNILNDLSHSALKYAEDVQDAAIIQLIKGATPNW